MELGNAVIVMGMVLAFLHGVMAATIVLTNVEFAMDQEDANNVMEIEDIMKKGLTKLDNYILSVLV